MPVTAAAAEPGPPCQWLVRLGDGLPPSHCRLRLAPPNQGRAASYSGWPGLVRLPSHLQPGPSLARRLQWCRKFTLTSPGSLAPRLPVRVDRDRDRLGRDGQPEPQAQPASMRPLPAPAGRPADSELAGAPAGASESYRQPGGLGPGPGLAASASAGLSPPPLKLGRRRRRA